MTNKLPLCIVCTHYLSKKKCGAYPTGIPLEIITEKVDHHKPYKGDHGIQFAAKRD